MSQSQSDRKMIRYATRKLVNYERYGQRSKKTIPCVNLRDEGGKLMANKSSRELCVRGSNYG